MYLCSNCVCDEVKKKKDTEDLGTFSQLISQPPEPAASRPPCRGASLLWVWGLRNGKCRVPGQDVERGGGVLSIPTTPTDAELARSCVGSPVERTEAHRGSWMSGDLSLSPSWFETNPGEFITF